MVREIHQWYSPALQKEMPIAVYGHYGFALLMIPTAAADFLEYERFELIHHLAPMIDAMMCADRGDNNRVPSTLVVSELISIMIDQGSIENAYMEPHFSQQVIDRLDRIYKRFAKESPGMQMTKADVERWLSTINGRVGRGSEFRNAVKYMGWKEPKEPPTEDLDEKKEEERPSIFIPDDSILTFSNFVGVYLDELQQGKFWGIAWDLAKLGEPLNVQHVFQARYDRLYCSVSLQPIVVLDTISSVPCPNEFEPSDHLPVCASFQVRKMKKNVAQQTT